MPLRNLPIKTGHLFMGLAAIMFIVTVSIFSGGKKEAPKKPVKIATQQVVVPLVPINEGKTLSMNDITTVKWPSDFLPKGVTFSSPAQVIGRVARQDLFPGEPIFTEKVSGSNTRGGLPAIIPQGMRAVSVAVTEVKGVAGFVKPGDRVDVLTTFEVKDQDSDEARTTKTVLQNVLVLASAQTMVDDKKYDMDTPDGVTRGEAVPSVEEESGKDKKKDKDKKEKKELSDKEREKEAKQREKEKKEAEKAARLVSSVTLALTPEQSETLALAEESGDIRLVLRPETDHAVVKLEGVNFDQLLGKPQAPRVARSAPAPMPSLPAMPVLGTSVEIIQGTEKTTATFE